MKTMTLNPSSAGIRARRLLMLVLTVALTGFLGWRTWELMTLNGVSPLEICIFGLFMVLILPISLSFWTALIGFFIQLRGGDALDLSRTLDEAPASGTGLPLTAIIMPVYNEAPERVFAGLKATYLSLERTGYLPFFEIFILSDTTDPDVWVREEEAFLELRKQVAQPERIFYRNRRQNVERKTGNIWDFISNWGERYKYMVVFDADSIMSGTSMVNLVRLMEAHPRVGIIQAPPLPVNRKSLFGRMHQFATHVYSRIFITGLNFWQGGAGNYWGHNAIIRIKPFVEHCQLPKLPGRAPLGGSILSHDFVEAAFMRRAGWRVYLASELRGSYEEMPSSLLGYAARDRRWCQGNLQHGKLIFMPGLHLVSRIHIWLGIMGYVASPLWMLMLLLTTIEGIRQVKAPHRYFQGQDSLFPTWQVSMETQAIALFALVMTLLILPKFLSLVLSLRRGFLNARFGSKVGVALSVLVETIVSSLLAPNLALLQSRFVIGILMGSNTKWEAQDRGDSGTTYAEAFHRHWPATLIGIGWTILLALTAPKLLLWFSPVVAGFLLAIPLSVWTSRATAGMGAARLGLFMIPEEIQPPQLISEFQAEIENTDRLSFAKPGNGIDKILSNSELQELHVTALGEMDHSLDPLLGNRLNGLVLKYVHEGLSSLSTQERRELLLYPQAIETLRAHTAPAEISHVA